MVKVNVRVRVGETVEEVAFEIPYAYRLWREVALRYGREDAAVLLVATPADRFELVAGSAPHACWGRAAGEAGEKAVTYVDEEGRHLATHWLGTREQAIAASWARVNRPLGAAWWFVREVVPAGEAKS